MGERNRFLLFIILGLIAFWFTVILLCFPQNEFIDKWSSNIERVSQNRANQSIISPKSPYYMKYFYSKFKPLKLSETLFYDFDPTPQISTHEKTDISQSNHKNATLQLALIRSPTDRFVKSEGDRLFAFNLLVSNRIGLSRALPVTRPSKCSNRDSSIKLKASIIICYYNEAPSALLRTINTVLERSPHQMIEEIIIVDDYSDPEFHMLKMKPHVNSNLVKFLRTSKREGLIRARLFGAKDARGDVLLFLDSHVEANIGWIEPLLVAVQENKTTIACPIIDVIKAENLVYTASPFVVGGMNWALNFRWDSVPPEKLKSYDDFVKPIDSPTMAGGLFAIDREFFYKLGAYDQAMELWGGENIELALRAWMCGGKVLVLPCSRLGHIFRKTRPYGPEPNQTDSLLLNSHRTARVWLDEHIEKFYEANPLARYLDSGEVTDRLLLKRSLNCKNFTWYLDNIYPRLKNESTVDEPPPKKADFINLNSKRVDRSVKLDETIEKRKQLQASPGLNRKFRSMSLESKSKRSVHSHFQIQLHNSDLCIESKGGFMARDFSRLVLQSCSIKTHKGQTSLDNTAAIGQLWAETKPNELRLGNSHCLDLVKNRPLLRKCHNMGSFQDWTINNRTQQGVHIVNSGGGLCLGVERSQLGEPLIVTICDMDFKHNVANRRVDTRNLPTSLRDRFLIAGWKTGAITEAKQANRRELRPLHPVQRWNILAVEDSRVESFRSSSSNLII